MLHDRLTASIAPAIPPAVICVPNPTGSLLPDDLDMFAGKCVDIAVWIQKMLRSSRWCSMSWRVETGVQQAS